MSETVLEVRHLKQYFSSGFGGSRINVKAVDDVSFSIDAGEVFGLVGESGCGKTTIARSVIRLYTPTGGDIIFKGRNIGGKRLSAADRRFITANIQMIFQDPVASLNPRMTVKDIVAEGLKINKLVQNEGELLEMVYEALGYVGLSKDHASRYPHEFSGGQRQRIGIARALITKPGFIIADEPVSALDVSIQAQVLNLINDLRERLGLTVLFIAHNLSVVKYFAKRIGVMYGGKIVEMGDADKIYKNPLHPYTKALLSAIPQPDPVFERTRNRIFFDGIAFDDSEWREMVKVEDGHYVYASERELKAYG